MQALFLCLALLLPRLAAACGPGTLTVINDSSAKILYQANAASPEPAGWLNSGFDDSAWAPALPWAFLGPFDGLGFPWSSHDLSGTSAGGDSFFYRQAVDLPPDAFDISAVLELGVDDNASTWANGVPVQADPPSMIGTEDPRVFNVGSLQPGRNILAVRCNSPVPTGMGVTLRLKVRYSRRCPDLDSAESYAFPSPAAGPRVQIAFKMPQAGEAELKAYSLSGRLLSQTQASAGAGHRVLDLDISGYAPGTYAYRLTLRAGGQARVLPWRTFIVARP